MSLNRRIYNWFLGMNDSSINTVNQRQENTEAINSSSYFIEYTKEILIESLKTLLDSIEDNTSSTCRIIKNEDDKQTTDTDNTLPSTWTLNKMIQILLVLGK